MEKCRQTLSFILAFIMTLSSVATVQATTIIDNSVEKSSLVNLYTIGSKGEQLLTWKGVIDSSNFAATMIVHRTADGQEVPAYCANPSKPGVEEAVGRNYDVSVSIENNPKVWAIVTNGYPYRTPAELGVSTDYEAYYATKMAIWATIHDNYSNINDWSANGSHNQDVETAMKSLYAIGQNSSQIQGSVVTISPVGQAITDDKGYYSQTYTVEGSALRQVYLLICRIGLKSYIVELEGDLPTGTIVTAMEGTEKNEFHASVTGFKVKVPTSTMTEAGTVKVNINATLENKSILYGRSSKLCKTIMLLQYQHRVMWQWQNLVLVQQLRLNHHQTQNVQCVQSQKYQKQD